MALFKTGDIVKFTGTKTDLKVMGITDNERINFVLNNHLAVIKDGGDNDCLFHVNCALNFCFINEKKLELVELQPSPEDYL